MIPPGEDSEFFTWFPVVFAPHTIPFADFAFHLLAEISHSREYESVLSSVSYPSELLKLGMILGIPTNTHIHILIHACVYVYIHTHILIYI